MTKLVIGPDIILSDNLIVEVPNAFSDEYCDQLVIDFQKSDKKLTAINTKYGSMDFYEAKLAAIKSDNDWQGSFLVKAMELGRSYLKLAKMPEYCFPDSYSCEIPRLKKYVTSVGRFEHHVDVGNHDTARRFLVIMLYLNNVDSGGETEFPIHHIKVKPSKGKVVMFPAGFTHPHAGLTPYSGSKYIASTYLHYL